MKFQLFKKIIRSHRYVDQNVAGMKSVNRIVGAGDAYVRVMPRVAITAATTKEKIRFCKR